MAPEPGRANSSADPGGLVRPHELWRATIAMTGPLPPTTSGRSTCSVSLPIPIDPISVSASWSQTFFHKRQHAARLEAADGHALRVRAEGLQPRLAAAPLPPRPVKTTSGLWVPAPGRRWKILS